MGYEKNMSFLVIPESPKVGEKLKRQDWAPLIDLFIYEVNYGLLINTSLSGLSKGLSVILDAQADLHVAAPRQNTGFKVLLHPRGEEPNLVDFGVELDLGKHTSVRILPREVTNFIFPDDFCTYVTIIR